MKKLSDYIGGFSFTNTGYSDTLEKNVSISTPTEALNTLLDIVPVRDVTLNDNTTNYVVVGAADTDMALEVQYVMSDGTNEQIGTIKLIHDSVNANIDHEQTGNPDLFETVADFSADIDTNDLRLVIDLSGVGSNLSFRYKIDSIKKIV